MTSFVSQADVEAEKERKKDERRKARDNILKDARQSFEREKQRLELKRQRGDDQWLAPGVNSRLGKVESAEENETTKTKDRKRHKKPKKKGDDASPTSSGDEKATWVEIDSNKNVVTQPPAVRPKSPVVKRDDWMLMPMAPSSLSLAIINGKQSAAQDQPMSAKLQCADKPGQHPREINPFWKGGGTGLPEGEKHSSASEQKPSGSKVNAAGRSWMLRAYKRALEQSETEDRSLEDIARERWGSLDKLYSLLQDAGIDPKNPDAPRPSGRKEYLYSAPRSRERAGEHDEGGVRGEGRRESRDRGEHNHDRSERRPGEEDDYGGEGRRESRDREEHNHDRSERRPGEKDGYGGEGRREWRDRREHGRDVKVQGAFLKPGDGGPDGLKGSRDGGYSSREAKWRKDSGKGPVTQQQDGEVRVGDRHGCEEGTEEDEKPDILSTKSEPEEPVHETSFEENIAAVPMVCADDPLEEQEPVTDMQLNTLSAKILKAEMVGDEDKIAALQRELEQLRARKESQTKNKPIDGPGTHGGARRLENERATRREEKTVVLTRADRLGNARPYDLPSSSSGYRSSQPTHSKKGKRERYFHDDDRHSLRDLMEQERMTTAEDTHAMVARMASKFVPASHLGETVDDLVDSKTAMRSDPGREDERERQRALRESRRMTEALENCHFCVASTGFGKHLLVAMGMSVYLCVPSHESLTEGHCLLVPTEHTSCALVVDENVWSEVRIFQKGLTRMFSDRGMDVVFMETYMSARSKAHMCIDCVPLPRETGSMAPMYFKKAILECDEEWAQNRKLVDTQKKGLRGSVPAGLPYFSVDFGLDNGFAHVIEDTYKFPRYFGREVVGGMLDVEPRLWLKPPKESFERQKKKVMQMWEWWKPYDWTQKLKQ